MGLSRPKSIHGDREMGTQSWPGELIPKIPSALKHSTIPLQPRASSRLQRSQNTSEDLGSRLGKRLFPAPCHRCHHFPETPPAPHPPNAFGNAARFLNRAGNVCSLQKLRAGFAKSRLGFSVSPGLCLIPTLWCRDNRDFRQSHKIVP